MAYDFVVLESKYATHAFLDDCGAGFAGRNHAQLQPPALRTAAWTCRIVSFHQHHATAISSAAALGHGDVLLSVIDDVNARAVRARAGVPAAAEVLGHAEAVTPPRAVVAVVVTPPRAVAAVAFGGVALVAGAIALAGALVPVGAAVRVPAPAVPAPAPPASPPASPPFFAGVVA